MDAMGQNGRNISIPWTWWLKKKPLDAQNLDFLTKPEVWALGRATLAGEADCCWLLLLLLLLLLLFTTTISSYYLLLLLLLASASMFSRHTFRGSGPTNVEPCMAPWPMSRLQLKPFTASQPAIPAVQDGDPVDRRRRLTQKLGAVQNDVWIRCSRDSHVFWCKMRWRLNLDEFRIPQNGIRMNTFDPFSL